MRTWWQGQKQQKKLKETKHLNLKNPQRHPHQHTNHIANSKLPRDAISIIFFKKIQFNLFYHYSVPWVCVNPHTNHVGPTTLPLGQVGPGVILRGASRVWIAIRLVCARPRWWGHVSPPRRARGRAHLRASIIVSYNLTVNLREGEM